MADFICCCRCCRGAAVDIGPLPPCLFVNYLHRRAEFSPMLLIFCLYINLRLDIPTLDFFYIKNNTIKA